MSKEITFSDEARKKLSQGVQKLTDSVKVTMGPRGRNVLIQHKYGATITKDGVSVAKEVELEDSLENMGAQIVKEVSAKTAEQAGDGTTTATVLANAIFQEGLRNITAGANPIEVKRGMDKAVEALVENLKSMAKPISSRTEIEQVATISANSDAVIGSLIAEAMEKVGKDGVITVEEANGVQDELEVVEGMQFERGYLSPHFITNPEKMLVELDNPLILLTEYKISNIKELLPVLEQTQQTNRPLLLIAEDIDGEALATLVVNKLRGILNVTAVKAPGYGDNRKAMLQDIAVLTSGVVITEELGRNLESVTLADLGTAGRVVVTKDSTTLVDGQSRQEAVELRVKEVKAQLEVTTNEYEKERLLERLAKLSGGVAVIKVGAVSDIAMKERKDLVDDSLSATKAAVQEGIVIGGGSALIKASRNLETDLSGDQKIGFDIVKRAISAPLRQISANAGYDAGVVVNAVVEADMNVGFDASKGVYVDMFESGIIDPLKVERVALTNAVSVSGLLLTTEVAITNVKADT